MTDQLLTPTGYVNLKGATPYAPAPADTAGDSDPTWEAKLPRLSSTPPTDPIEYDDDDLPVYGVVFDMLKPLERSVALLYDPASFTLPADVTNDYKIEFRMIRNGGRIAGVGTQFAWALIWANGAIYGGTGMWMGSVEDGPYEIMHGTDIAQLASSSTPVTLQLAMTASDSSSGMGQSDVYQAGLWLVTPAYAYPSISGGYVSTRRSFA